MAVKNHAEDGDESEHNKNPRSLLMAFSCSAGSILWFDPRREHSSVPTAQSRSRRAQGLSRSAVALSLRHALSFPVRALTGPSTVASLIGLGLQGAGIRTVMGGIRWPVSRPRTHHVAGSSEGARGGTRAAGSGLFLFAGAPAQTVALEFDAMGVVNDAVQYGIAERGVGNDVVPLRERHLACDQERSLVVAVIDDLEEIATLFGSERLGSPIVDDDEVCALQRRHQAR